MLFYNLLQRFKFNFESIYRIESIMYQCRIDLLTYREVLEFLMTVIFLSPDVDNGAESC